MIGVMFSRTFEPREVPGSDALALKTLGRSQIGLRVLAEEMDQEKPRLSAAEFQAAFDSLAASDEDRARVAVLAGEILGGEEARRRIQALAGDVPLLRRIYEAGAVPLDPAERRELRDQHGWFGDLALVYGLPQADPARAAFLADARRFALTLSGISLAALVGILASLVLFAVACVRLARGRLRVRDLPPPAAPLDLSWLEVPALLLLGVLLLGLFDAGPYGIWLLALVPFWPLLWGMPWEEWRTGLGLTSGRGVLREAGAGALGYLALLPLVALSLVLTMALARWTGSGLSHPYVEEALGGGEGGFLRLLIGACLWAPLIEEAVFRGALWRYLRPRTGVAFSAILVGLLFALAHPQGFAALPTLTALGACFALLRHWRGTLAAPIAAHALHNGILVGLLHLVSS